jgi:hypothetical protein
MAVTLEKVALETVAALYLEGIPFANMTEAMMMGRCTKMLDEQARNRGLSPVYPSTKPNFQGAKDFAERQESFGRNVFQWMSDGASKPPEVFTLPPAPVPEDDIRVIAALVRMMGGCVILDAHDLKPLEMTPVITTEKLLDPYGLKIKVLDASEVEMH